MIETMSDRAIVGDPDAIRDEEIGRFFGKYARVRLVQFVLPTSFVAWIAVADSARWRRTVLLFVLGFAVTLMVRELLLFRRAGVRRVRFGRTMQLATVGHLVMTSLTGGIESPFAFGFAPFALFTGGTVTDPRARIRIAAVQVTGIWAMTLCAASRAFPGYAPLPFGGGPNAGHNTTLLLVEGALSSALVVFMNISGAKLRTVFDTLVGRLADSRAQTVNALAEQTELLRAFSAEIAHELKNPLASVKGLTTLMASGQEGKNAERVVVLRREIDRMQGILEEFLNFARPIGVLARAPVDLGAVCRSAVELHEGLFQSSSIEVIVDAPSPVRVPCDERKVAQIVINLLQNAIAADRAGGEIHLQVVADDGTARIRVSDRGPGLDPSIAGRAFEKGTTTRANGSGLGLTIARELVRQHGGEITLVNRDGGGCVAEVTLPMEAEA